LHLLLCQNPDRKWYDWKFGDGGVEWYLTNPEEIRREAIECGQFRKDAKKALDLYDSICASWHTGGWEEAKREFPEIERPQAVHLFKLKLSRGK
jgi:hypothetical protein